MIVKNWVFNFGKFKGKSLDQIDLKELDGYVGWIESLESPTNNLVTVRKIILQYLKDPSREYLLDVE